MLESLVQIWGMKLMGLNKTLGPLKFMLVFVLHETFQWL